MADQPSNNPAGELDRCLGIVGLGRCNLRYCAVFAFVLVTSILETVGNSIVLPAAKCDLDMSDFQRGFVASIPHFGIILTSYMYGYFVDTLGRRKLIIWTCFAGGIFSSIASFMPGLISFSFFKLLNSLCLAVPSAVPYTFIAEVLPVQHRDLILSLAATCQLAGTSLVPLIAWVIIPLDFRIDLGAYVFRPWRLLNMIYAVSCILAAAFVAVGPESPKFLVAQGKAEAALKVMQTMYAGNKKQRPEDLPVKSLPVPPTANANQGILTGLKLHTKPLLKCPNSGYLFLNGFLLFGIFSILNGLYMWVPDVLNRVLTGREHGKTACEIILERFEKQSDKCNDSFDTIAFAVNTAAQLSCAIVGFCMSTGVKVIGKKIMLLVLFVMMGFFCILIKHITNDVVFTILMCTFPLLAIGIGCVNAYSVQLFPTHLRGMALCLSMMLGRFGSLFGNTFAGAMINVACDDMFYTFGFILLACAALTLIHK